MCVDCEEYDPCIPVCPPITCENMGDRENLLDQCKDNDYVCVDGCESPECPDGYIRLNSSSPAVCIEENDCRVNCIINGTIYEDKDPITDPEICSPCQTW